MFYRKTLKNILIISCAIAIIYPVVNFYSIFPAFSNISVHNAKDEAVRVAQHLASMIVSDNYKLKDPVHFSDAIKNATEDLHLEKLKIFSSNGKVIYSSDPEDIGQTNTKKYFHDIAARGNIYTKVVQKDSTTPDGRIVTSDVVATYVPIRSDSTLIGAFEIYYDITAKNQTLNKVVLRSSLLTFSLMFGFFIALIAILIRSDNNSSSPEVDPDLMKSYHSPFTILFLMVISIFSAEAIVMLLISAFPGMTLLEETILNSAMLIMLVSPVLYYFLLRPLMHQINERHSAEDNLRNAHDELERRVLARTYELAKSNKQLTEEMTKRLKVVGELQESEEKYRILVNSTDDSIYLVDRDCKYLFMNKKHITRLGLSDDDYLGKQYSDFHPQDISTLFFEKVNNIFDSGSPMQFEYKSETDDRYFLQTLSPVKSPGGKTFAVSVVSKNITDRKIMEEELRTLSLTDALTGLYNRRGFHALAEQQLRMANRLKKGIFMLYADIDNLKEINDTYGHQEGDRILVEFARILKENYRESDIIARIGGDEYIVIPVGGAEDDIEVINSRFYACLERYNKKSDLKHDITASIGIVFYDPASPCTIESLLVQADKLMYCQKKVTKK